MAMIKKILSFAVPVVLLFALVFGVWFAIHTFIPPSPLEPETVSNVYPPPDPTRAYPPPPEPTLVPGTPMRLPTSITVGEGEEFIPPTETHLPTLTPRPTSVNLNPYPGPAGTHLPTLTPHPTPTRRPGPTPTGVPLRGPADSPAGVIWYATIEEIPVTPDTESPSSSYSFHTLRIDPAGQPSGGSEYDLLLERADAELDHQIYAVYPSPDGRYLLLLAYVSLNGYKPFALNMETGLMKDLIPDDPNSIIRFWFHGWHPDSRQILLENDYYALFLMDVETGEETILDLIRANLQGAAISPDGLSIAYVTFFPSYGETLRKVSSAGSDAQSLLYNVGEVLSWSPDGEKVLFQSGPGTRLDGTSATLDEQGGGLWVVDPVTLEQHQLKGSFWSSVSQETSWSPDGEWIAYSGFDEGQTHNPCVGYPNQVFPRTCVYEGTAVYIENMDTGEVRRLAAGIEPAWSPDGSRLVFLSIQSGQTELWMIRTDGSDLQQLTRDGLLKYTNVLWSGQ